MNEKLIKLNYSKNNPSFIKKTNCSITFDEYFPIEKLTSSLHNFITEIKKIDKSTNTISNYRNNIIIFCEFLTGNKINSKNSATSTQELWLNFLKENGRESKESVRRIQMSVHYFLHFLASGELPSQANYSQFSFPMSEHPIQWDL